ncbi:L-type lectin-domain containing receptor kinase VIII.1-like [Chenopodium quinoa]|uniref:L-type lectin-domain containing receptor kinase VIII.1-like n=1 Tax=Chenopodium quinoa TaxID=63459 RepID=UPI000B76F9E2|nr:L-type lectin-domain containing receptor kinase VIII.1-like [Chenopodium quinoa]
MLTHHHLNFIFITFIIMVLSIHVSTGVSTTNGGDTTEFDFGTLTLTSLKLLGDAHLNNGSVRLTRDLPVPNSGAGRVFYSRPVKFRQAGTNFPVSFTTFFSFAISNLNPSSIGGGLAFIISPDNDSNGAAGGFLGLNQGSNPGFVAVEFDTLMDVEFKDINSNHVGLDLGSMVSAHVSDLDTINVDLKSGDLINTWIDYSGLTQIFSISISYSNVKPKLPLLSFSFDLDNFVSDEMFVGFTGSTQGSTETHSIDWWSFTSSFESSSTSSDPQPSPPFTVQRPPSGTTTVAVHAPPPAIPPSHSKSIVSTNKSSCGNQLCKRNPAAVAGVVTASAFMLALFGGTLFWFFSKKSKVKLPRNSTSCSLATDVIKMPKEFSYKELKIATKGFDSSRVIGHGAFGTVYKGILPETGHVIAVKRCSNNNGGQGKNEFLSELSIIGSLRHRNLVRLQGWCHEKEEILLVYDLMPNGSLDKALFESRVVLCWPHRRKILLGVASALAYLHQECENLVVHRDVKTSNIMLDEAFNAKLSDFGLARQMEHDKSPDATVAAGTMGYLAPEYLLTGRATDKTDVFSYGAVTLEVATGRRPIEKEKNGTKGHGNLVEWVWGLHTAGRLLEAVDERLNEEFDEGEMRRVLLVGLACSHPDPLARPTMRSVVQMLVGEAEVPIVPRTKPSMSFSTSQLLLNLQDSVSDCNAMLTISTSSSSSDRNLFLPGGGTAEGGSGGDDLV